MPSPRSKRRRYTRRSAGLGATALLAVALCQGGSNQKAVWGAALRHSNPEDDYPCIPNTYPVLPSRKGILDSQHLYIMEEGLAEVEGRVEKLKWEIGA